MDEVPARARKQVVEIIIEFISLYPQHRYLVTCRPYAYIGQPWRLPDFQEVTLAPFTEEQLISLSTSGMSTWLTGIAWTAARLLKKPSIFSRW